MSHRLTRTRSRRLPVPTIPTTAAAASSEASDADGSSSNVNAGSMDDNVNANATNDNDHDDVEMNDSDAIMGSSPSPPRIPPPGDSESSASVGATATADSGQARDQDQDGNGGDNEDILFEDSDAEAEIDPPQDQDEEQSSNSASASASRNVEENQPQPQTVAVADVEEDVIEIESEYGYSTDEDIAIIPASPPGNSNSSDGSSARVVPSTSRSMSMSGSQSQRGGHPSPANVTLSSLARRLGENQRLEERRRYRRQQRFLEGRNSQESQSQPQQQPMDTSHFNEVVLVEMDEDDPPAAGQRQVEGEARSPPSPAVEIVGEVIGNSQQRGGGGDSSSGTYSSGEDDSDGGGDGDGGGFVPQDQNQDEEQEQQQPQSRPSVEFVSIIRNFHGTEGGGGGGFVTERSPPRRGRFVLPVEQPPVIDLDEDEDDDEYVPEPMLRPRPRLNSGGGGGGGEESGSLLPPTDGNNDNEGDGDTEDSDGEDEEEEEGPARKMPKLDTSTKTADEDEGFTCQICYEPFTNSGGHRVCCLKCGHVYGKECIERWIHSSKRCPSCNCKAMKKDIRVIYVKNLKAADTAELERLKEEMQKVMIEKNRIELSYQTMKQKEFLCQKEIDRLRQENLQLKSSLSSTGFRRHSNEDQTAGPSSSSSSQVPVGSSSHFSNLKMPKLALIKQFPIKEGQCRIGAFNEWSNLYVVSHSIKSALFPGGSHGIKKINSLEWKVHQSFPIHSKPIRDMCFSPLQPDLLLTVGLDKKAILFNSDSNVAVQTFNMTFPLWSCCWNTVNQHIFYVGAANGQVTSYDIRAPHEPLGQLFIPTEDRSSVARLKFVPPAYQNQSFNMSGLLIQKLNSVWMGEMLGGVGGGGNQDSTRYFQLPLEGPFSNIDFEPNTRQVLVSCRPKHGGPSQKRQGSNHLVCDLKKAYSEEEQRDLFSCDVVQSITAGFQESSVLCRSALFKAEDNVYLTANGEGNKTVRVWDVSNTEQKSLIRINDELAMDYIPGRINGGNFLGIVTDKSTDIYDIKS